jgi:hypothetical protein
VSKAKQLKERCDADTQSLHSLGKPCEPLSFQRTRCDASIYYSTRISVPQLYVWWPWTHRGHLLIEEGSYLVGKPLEGKHLVGVCRQPRPLLLGLLHWFIPRSRAGRERVVV